MYTEFSDRNITTKALRITEILDSNRIKTFHVWNYDVRGDYEIWSKQDAAEIQYSCMYREEKDTAFLRVYLQTPFMKDFPTNLKLDTARYWQVNVHTYSGKIFTIISVNHQGHDHITDTIASADQVFQKNPITHFSSLSALKDSLGVYGIAYNSKIGNFITFWLSPQHKLTYLPDNLILNPKYAEPWLADFRKGKMIKKNWNLRKLDEPREGG